jgi:hypothetical protein
VSAPATVVRRRVAIMQPTYLPYLGYFELIAQSDLFVFLDDVQFERRSWQSRNRILGPAGELMLTVPVKKHAQDTVLREIRVSEDQPWREKHLATIRHVYAGRPHLSEVIDLLEGALQVPARLSNLNFAIIASAAARLGLTTPMTMASAMNCGGRRSQHLLNICRAAGATEYLSTTGSREYLETDGVFAWARMPIRYFAHEPKPYPQARPEFTPYMAFIDAVANLGWDGTAALLDRG